ncbi:TRAP transporter small permease [Desulfocurvus sp. DL9XJH121]
MAVTSVLIVSMICFTVVLRYVFGSDFYGSEELIQMLAFWLYFMGAAQGSREKSQISADILSCYITNPKWGRVVGLVKDVATVAICLLVTCWACQFVAWGFMMMPKSPVFRLPMLIPHTAIGLGFVLMSLYHVVYLGQDLAAHLKLSRAGE